MLECFAWLAFSFVGILRPGQEDKVFTYGQPLMLAEVAVMLWLVIMGARAQRLAVPKSWQAVEERKAEDTTSPESDTNLDL